MQSQDSGTVTIPSSHVSDAQPEELTQENVKTMSRRLMINNIIVFPATILLVWFFFSVTDQMKRGDGADTGWLLVLASPFYLIVGIVFIHTIISDIIYFFKRK